MDGKAAIVTGGTAGIGAAVAGLFAAEGIRLVLVARREPDERWRTGLAAAGADVRFVAGDVREAATAQAAVDLGCRRSDASTCW